VDLNQQKLLAYGLSAQDVSAALGNQDIVLPAGDQKIGAIDFLVETNAQPVDVPTFNSLPIMQVGNTVVTVGDVANVYLGGQPQTNAVLVHGRQAVLLEILKAGDASTLAIVAGVKAKIPEIERTLPKGVQITALNDASTFVRASVEDVVQEMATATQRKADPAIRAARLRRRKEMTSSDARGCRTNRTRRAIMHCRRCPDTASRAARS
jgi:multidrug efflux pump subunit AcrB